MTDQELLTYAAKAAGYEINFESEINGYYAHGYDSSGDVEEWWSPLIDNGDAFKLMVNLHMSVRHMSWLSKDAWKIQVGVCMDFLTEEKCGDDPLQAARRAIVEMAAEIGKGM